jgi:hypothetical protein
METIASSGTDTLIAKRDSLLAVLRRSGVQGVRGVGLTRTGGSEHLLLLVAHGFGSMMPREFEGVPVTVRETGLATA